jgi:NADPH2:quinone reductase
MRAIVIESADRFVWAEVPTPSPKPGEVVIKVSAAGINRADLLQAAGHYPPPAGASEILGLEVSGTIADIGEEVANWTVGQPVCALLAGGGYAEYVAVPAQQVLPIPDGVGLQDAAALPEVACTVWSNLVMSARIQPGEVLLVHGGASGIGSHAIQVAKQLGAHVAVTAGSAAKLTISRELGADTLICYRDEDFVDRVRETTEGRGADVILDVMGAAYLDRNLDALAVDGRLAIIGMQGGVKGELNIGKLVSKRLQVIGTALRSRPIGGSKGKGAIVDAVTESVWPMISAGTVQPVIGAHYPIEDAAQAHQALKSGQTYGKILLTVGD